MPDTTNVIIAGAAGRMGRQLITIASQTPGVRITGAFEIAEHAVLGKDAGFQAGIPPLGCPVVDNPAKTPLGNAVLIDFTSPQSTMVNLERIAEKRGKAVVGTTGFTQTDKARIREFAADSAVVLAPNMSVGMNLLFQLTRKVAATLGEDYDIEIVEAHHRFKKDAPSGTAARLAEMAAEGRKIHYPKNARHGRQGMTGARRPDEIGMHALRAGDIVGDHTVLFGSLGERVELRHQAHSREPFARGAIRAAQWIADKPAGLFDMADVLGLKGNV